MRRVREVLRLAASGLSTRQVAQGAGIARSTAAECLRRAQAAGIVWPPPADLDEAELERRLYPRPPPRADAPPLPDCARLHVELRHKGVTLRLLWQEYRTEHPDGYQYSRFCDHYRAWRQDQDVVLRQTHAPGDKCFVDYAGPTMPVTDPRTGEVQQAQIFVGVLGYSNYAYVEATWTQGVADWLASHVRMLEFFGGASAVIVPDNLKSAVIRPHRYDPDLNPAYQDFAEHYGLTILPARVRKPRDKAKAEGTVLIVERFILGRLRHAQFFSLAALNVAIRTLLAELNHQPFQKLDGCRASWWEQEKPALRALPASPYEYAVWKKAKVHLDYHVEVERHYYSVPCALVGRTLDVRVSATSVEILDHGQRVAAHLKSSLRGGFTTVAAHRPEKHQAIVERSMERLLAQAAAIGPATVAVLKAQALARKHPEYAIRASLGILRLGRDFTPERLEAACRQAVTIKTFSYRAVRSLIQAAFASSAAIVPASTVSPAAHVNLRGPTYYH